MSRQSIVTSRPHPLGFGFLCQRARCSWGSLFRAQSRIQTDGSVLCPSHRHLFIRKMYLLRNFQRVGRLFMLITFYSPIIGSVSGRLFIQLGIVTSATFILLFLPFLPPLAPITNILDPITRIFPFNRGLFEDKVANFWCASNVAFKWKNWASREALVKLSTALTAIGFLPSVAGLIRGSIISRPTSEHEAQASSTPTLSLLPYALLNSSMSFFLFSFQVHEKTILLPLLPMTLLLSGAPPNSSVYAWGVLANNIGVFRFVHYILAVVHCTRFDFWCLCSQHVAFAQTRWLGCAIYLHFGTLEYLGQL